jgi:predicted DNA-binding protein (MmcQ/YjbR family)
MGVDWVRRCCLSLPHTTEEVLWQDNLVFKVGGKMFAIASLEPASVFVSFKCTPEDFARLTDLPDIIPAPYLARAQWVALESEDALPVVDTRLLLRKSYDLVFAKLTKKAQAGLRASSTGKRSSPIR